MSESTADMRSEPVEDRKHGEDPSRAQGTSRSAGKPMRPPQSAGDARSARAL